MKKRKREQRRLTHVERRIALILIATGAFIAIAVVLLALGFRWWPFSLLGLLVLLGVGVASSSGHFLDWRSWLRGGLGETEVARALDQLGSEFVVINDLKTLHGNVDHVVVGPTGIFAIETKSWGGTVSDRPEANTGLASAVRQAVQGAMWVRERGKTDRFVQALVVFPFAGVRGDVIVLPNAEILPLTLLPERLVQSKSFAIASGDVARIAERLRPQVGARPHRLVRIAVLLTASALVVLVAIQGPRSREVCSGTIEWAAAASCIDEFVEVRGVVASVEESTGGVWVNLGNAYPIRPRVAVLVRGASMADAKDLEGMTIRVKGIPQLQTDGRTPQLEVSSLADLARA